MARAQPDDTTAEGDASWSDHTTELAGTQHIEADAPVRIGPYVTLERLGSGGMGVVYAAHDPRLDRNVAVKVLHESAARGADGAQRLIREARALARLTHPNVVAVYDVGTVATAHGERVYLAMELVDGTSLTRWQRATARSIPEILAKYLDAGRGLAAAHAQGLVHRDFKPDNVLVDSEGRVRVLDFGLAIGPELPPPDLVETLESTQSPASRITATGVIIGTLAYMAPEQLHGLTTDARADQFAFCVALFEALLGRRPYAGRDVRELGVSLSRGEIAAPSDMRRLPRWLRNALVRGLRPDPEDRWPSMQHLLDAIGRHSRPSRSRAIAAAIGIVGVAGAIAVASPSSTEHDPCRSASARIEPVWGAVQRGQVRDAVLGTNLSYAADTWVRVERSLDEYGRQWAGAREVVCRADTAAELPREEADLRMRCLEGRLDAMGALIQVLSLADVATVERASAAVAKLPPVATCDNPDEIRAWLDVPSDPARAELVQALRRDLAEAAALEWAGRYADGKPIARAVIDAASDLAEPVVEAEARRQLGLLHYRLGEYEHAEREMSSASWLALEQGRDRLAASSMTELVALVGYTRARPDEALTWSRHASAAQARAPGRPLDAARLTSSLGALAYRRGDYAGAERLYRQAREILRDPSDDETRQELSNVVNNLGNAMAQLARYDEAHEYLSESIGIMEALRGASHPDVATPIANLANVQLDRGRYGDAELLHARALDIRRRALGEEHPMTASSWMNLGTTLSEQGEYARALEHLERSLAVKQDAFGPTHPDVAMAHNNLGEVQRKLGETAAAIASHETALAIWSETMGDEHPYIAYPLTNLGLDLLAAEDLPRARAMLGRAITTCDDHRLDPALCGLARFGLARALEESGEPSWVTVPLVLAAQSDLTGRTRRYDIDRAAITAWLAAQP